jgi:hypothetical protein
LSINLVADERLGWDLMLIRVTKSEKRLAAFPQCKMVVVVTTPTRKRVCYSVAIE